MSRKTKNYYFLLFLNIIILIVAMISGCKDESKNPANTLRIGVALYQQDDTFIASITQNLQKSAQQVETKRENFQINLSIMDARSNQTTQMEQIDTLIKRGCDVLCINIVDRTAAAVVISKAKEENIPVIFFNRQPVEEDMRIWDKAYYVGSKADEGGKMQGEIVLQAWQENTEKYDKNKDGILQYIMLEGEPGHQDALLRTEYSVKTLIDNDILVEKLASDTANWNRAQAMEKVRQWINQFGDNIEVVFANNDDMALGAIDAFLASSIDMPLVVGVDGTNPALEAMEKELLYGTVKNDAERVANSIITLALSINDNEKLELENGHYLWLDYEKLTILDIK